MLKTVTFEAKNEQEAYKEASKQLRLAPEQIKLTIIKEKKGILGIGASTTYEATPDIDLAIAGKDYIDSMIRSLGIDVKMEMKKDDNDHIMYHVYSDENALLIGKEGRTLQAFQHLLRTYLSNFADEFVGVSLDIGDYNAQRKLQLEILATKTAKKVTQFRKEIKLKPMTAYERKIIHAKLGEWRDVETVSAGEGENRAIIIKLKDKI